MKCNQTKCENEAVYKYTWPGKDESFICKPCSEKVLNVAKAVGFHIQVRPINMTKELNLMNNIKNYIIKKAKQEFGFAGLAEHETGCMINTGTAKQLIIKIEITT